MPAFTMEFTVICTNDEEAIVVAHDIIRKALRQHGISNILERVKVIEPKTKA